MAKQTKKETDTINMGIVEAMKGAGAENYAAQEGYDIQQAASAIAQIANLMSSEALSGEKGDVAALSEIIRGLTAFIEGELQEANDSMGAADDEEAEAKRNFDPNVGGGVDRDKLKGGDFVFSDERKFPVVTKADVMDAVHSWGRYEGKHSFEEFKKRLTSLAKRKGFESALPEDWGKKNIITFPGTSYEVNMEKEEQEILPPSSKLNLSYVKSLGVLIPNDQFAVKYIGKDTIRHYSFLWGNPNARDIEGEYFTRNDDPAKSTDLWDAKLGTAPKPLTWDHAQDADFKSDPVIGMSMEWGDDEVGRWVISKLDRAHRYRKAIDALIERGVLGTSSDSAPQYVRRVKVGKGVWLHTWPWFASALTDTPAEPRMIDSVDYLKSLGVRLPAIPDEQAWKFADMRRQAFDLFQNNLDKE